MKIILIFLVLFLGQNLLSQTSIEKIKQIDLCGWKLENIKQLTDEQSKYHRAILSPDAKKILLFSKDKTQIMDIQSKRIIRNIEYYYDGQWISNSAIMFQEGGKYKAYKINLDTERVSLPVPEIYIEDKHIVKARKNGVEWVIADLKNSDNLVIFKYLFSDDFKNVVIYTNGISYIFKVDGSGQLFKDPTGFISDWSSSNNSFISFLDLNHGEDYLVESDIYITNIDSGHVCKLTDTKDILEVRPSWSQNKITYVDGKTEIVYIANIIKR